MTAIPMTGQVFFAQTREITEVHIYLVFAKSSPFKCALQYF